MGGGHKSLLSLGKDTLLEHVIKRASPQVDRLILNVNEDTALFEFVNLPFVEDTIDGFAGPLAGVLAGMEWSKKNAPGSNWIATFAADTPLVVSGYVAAGEDCDDAHAASSAGAFREIQDTL